MRTIKYLVPCTSFFFVRFFYRIIEGWNLLERLLTEDISLEYLVSALVSMSYKPLDIKVDSAPERKQKQRNFKKGETTAIHINIGKKLGVTPSHLVAAIVEYTNRSSDIIGKIDMYDKKKKILT